MRKGIRDTLTTVAVIAAISTVAVTSAPSSADHSTDPTYHQPEQPGTGALAPCSVEDQTQPGCVWDAWHRDGPGGGSSFIITRQGKFKIIPHYAAHVLIFGED